MTDHNNLRVVGRDFFFFGRDFFKNNNLGQLVALKRPYSFWEVFMG